MRHHNELSLKRQQRAERQVTSKGVKDGRCIGQEMTDVGTWPSGQPKQVVEYLHVTKGRRTRLLPPLFNTVLAKLNP
jgi:hypothetical protein